MVVSSNFDDAQGDSAVALLGISPCRRGERQLDSPETCSPIANSEYRRSAAVLLLAIEKATKSKALFLLQLPGFVASAGIWGVHSSPENPVAGFVVFSAANALAYWPSRIRIKFSASKQTFKLIPYRIFGSGFV